MNLRTFFMFAAMFALVLAGSLNIAANSAAAQAAPEDARSVELRKWFESQTPQRQDLLKRRLRVIKRLPKDKQAEVFKAVSEGKPMLSEKQRENLETVRKLPYLERVRLYTVSRELDMIRRGNPVGFKRAQERPDRAKALAELLLVHRAQMALSPQDREHMKTLRAEERIRFLREKLEQNGRERLERITFLDPRILDLRKAAAGGDQAARAELREAMADLGTLDMLMQRLTPDRQQKVMEELRGLGLEKAVDLVRKELKGQWSEMDKKRPNKEERDRPGPDSGFRPGDRRGLAPKDERPKDK